MFVHLYFIYCVYVLHVQLSNISNKYRVPTQMSG